MTDPTTAHVEPCPWCGSPAEIATNDDGGAAPWRAAWVRCTKRPGCEAEGTLVKLAKRDDPEGKAIAAWNKVASAVRRADALERELREAREASARALDTAHVCMDRALTAEARCGELREALADMVLMCEGCKDCMQIADYRRRINNANSALRRAEEN